MAIAGVVSLASFTVMTSAYASTNMNRSKIIVNGKTVETPYKFVAGNPATTYMPIWYVQQVVNQVLGTSGSADKWDGRNWYLTVNGAGVSSFDVGGGRTGIYVNGKLVENASTITAVDPDSGQQTTFMPIWYVQQLVNHLLGLDATTDHWDGTTWAMTQASVAPVTQSDMATAMWNTFAGVNWDINAHPSMSEVRIILSATAPVTAGQVATWLSEWATKAKGVNATWGPQKGQWIPYSIQYEASSIPYTWAEVNGLYQGTDVQSASSVITPSTMEMISSNLKWWLTGDRVVNGVHHLHVPFYSNYGMWYGDTTNSGAPKTNGLSEINYQSYLADETRYYDQIIAKVSGTTIQLTLQDTSHSASNMAWEVVNGYWEYGGWQAKDNRGGKTLNVPNSGTAGLTIDTASLNPQMYLEGLQVSIHNMGGVPVFSMPYDVGQGQYPPTGN